MLKRQITYLYQKISLEKNRKKNQKRKLNQGNVLVSLHLESQ
jgi:hypothetical protein